VKKSHSPVGGEGEGEQHAECNAVTENVALPRKGQQVFEEIGITDQKNLKGRFPHIEG